MPKLFLDPITTQQIAKINSLLETIYSHGDKINKPWGILAGSIIMPFLAEVLLLNKFSPFHSFYENLSLSYYQPKYNEMRNIFQDLENKSGKNDAKKSYLWMRERLQDLANYSFFNPSGNPMTFEQVLIKIEENPPETTLAKQGDLKTLEIINAFKVNMMALANKCGLPYNKYRQFPSFNVEQAEKYSMHDIAKILRDACEFYINNEEDFVDVTSDLTAKEHAKTQMNSWLIATQVALCAAGSYFLIIPTLNKFFPTGIWQHHLPPASYEYQLLSRIESDALIKELEILEKEIKKIAIRNTRLAGYFAILALFIGLYFLSIAESLPAIVIFAFIALVASCFTYVFNQIMTWQKNFRFDSVAQRNLYQIQSILKITKNYSIELVSHNHDLKSSQFSIHSSDQLHIDLLVASLLQYQVPIVASDKKNIILRADYFISTEKCVWIQTFFKALLAHKEAVNILRKQIEEINKILPGEFLMLENVDKNNLPYCDGELILPVKSLLLNSLLSEELLKITFRCNKITMIEEDDFLIINLEKMQPSTQGQFKEFVDECKKANKKQQDVNQITEKVLDAPPLLKKVHQSTKSSKPTVENQTGSLKKELHAPRYIRWPHSGKVYDSLAEDCEVFPIRDGRPLDNYFLNNCRRFICNGLLDSDLQNEKQANDEMKNKQEKFTLKNMVLNLVSNAHLGPHGGRSGWVCEVGVAKMRRRPAFRYHMKGILLGEYGDCRLYARKEEVNEGDKICSLYIVEAIELHAH